VSKWSFDGSNFRAVDDAAIGDGQGGSTMPLDTLLEHAHRNQAMWARKRDPGRSFSPDQGGRLSSVDWSAIWKVDIPIDKTVETVRVKIRAEVGTDESSPSTPSDYDTDTRLQLLGFDDVRVTTGLTGGGLTTITHELDVSSRAQVARWQPLLLLMRSAVGAELLSSDLFSVSPRATVEQSDFLNGGRAKAGRIEIGEDHSSVIDQIYEVDEYVHVVGPPGYRAAGEQGGDGKYYEHYLSWMKVHAVILEIDRDPKSLRTEPSQITHRIPYEAQWSSYRHARNLQKEYDYARAVSLGSGKCGRWTDHIHWANSGSTEVWADSLKLDLESDTVEPGSIAVRVRWLAAHVVAGYRPHLEGREMTEIVEQDGASVDVTITARLEQLADTDTWSDPTAIASASETWTDTDAVPTDETGRWPILQLLRWHRLGSDGTIDETEVWRERQVAYRDLGLFHVDGLRLELDEAALDRSLPTRLTITVETAATLFAINPLPDVDQASDDRVAVYVDPDVSVWEYGG